MMRQPPITLVLPFYNEESFLGKTLDSLRAQSHQDFVLHLVDNASTDGGGEIAEHFAASMPSGRVVLFREDRPGKIHALSRGMVAAKSEYVATLDADTVYPADYIARTLEIFGRGTDVAAVVAIGLPSPKKAERALAKARLKQSLFPGKCQSGGFGQAFRRSDLEAVGGFDAAIWPFVLEDHEIMARIGTRGRIILGWDHVCYPSDRRGLHPSAGWSLAERLLYQFMPVRALPWYFHSYLAARFRRRRLDNLQLRDQPWQSASQTP